jgi:hypothetical protein
VAAKADQADRTEHDDADPRARERLQALARQPRAEHEKWQREPRRHLDGDAGDERRRSGAKARGRRGAQQQRARKREQDQRVVVRAADGEHEQHRVQPDKCSRPACGVPEPHRSARRQRDRGEAREDRERLECPQRARQAEWRRRVAEEREQRAIRRALVGPADKREDFVARRLRGDVRVGVETVQRAEPGKADVAKDVLRKQRRSEQEDHVGREDRRGDRPERQRPGGEQHERVARAHDQRQRLKPPRAEADAEALEWAREPARPATRARGNVLRRFAGDAGARQEEGYDHAEQSEQSQRTDRRNRALRRARRCVATASARRSAGLNRRTRRGRGDRHRLIVTSTRGQACGGKCRIPSQARVTLAGALRYVHVQPPRRASGTGAAGSSLYAFSPPQISAAEAPWAASRLDPLSRRR